MACSTSSGSWSIPSSLEAASVSSRRGEMGKPWSWWIRGRSLLASSTSPTGRQKPRRRSTMTEIQLQLQEAIERLVESGAERGLQVAVYRHGEQVVDATAGVA